MDECWDAMIHDTITEKKLHNRVGNEDQIPARRQTLSVLSFGVALLIPCFFSQSIIATYLSLGLFIAYLGLESVIHPNQVIKYLHFYFGVVANIVGCASIELEYVTFLDELVTPSEFAGSLPLLVFSRWLFLVALQIFDNSHGVEIEIRNPNRSQPVVRHNHFLRVSSITVGILVLILFLKVVEHPSYIYGFDRFDYSNIFLSGAWGPISNYVGFFILIPLLDFRENKSHLAFFTVLLYIVFLFWTGVKFGEYFNLLCLLILVYYKNIISLSIKQLRRVLFACLIIFGTLIWFSTFAFSFTSSNSVDYFLVSRTAQQGQLWWKTYEQLDGDYYPVEFTAELESLNKDTEVSSNIDSENGIYKIMYYTTPREKVDSKLSSGSRYTEAGYASAYYYFGPLGVVTFSVSMALFAGYLQNSTIRALIEVKLVESVLLYRFSLLTQTALSMFIFGPFFKPLAIIGIVILILSACIASLGKRTA